MSATTAPRLGAKGTVDLPAELFGTEWHEHLVWHVVRNEQLARRQGTHATRSRGRVAGGSSKPWRQKGTGRARQGTTRAPQWRGGGVVFGPTPHGWGGKVNRKERRRAMRAALSLHAARGSLAVLADDAVGEVPSTKRAVELRASLGEQRPGKLAVVCTAEQEQVWKSFRNLPDVMVVEVTDLEVSDVLWGRSLVVTESALRILEGGEQR